MTSNFNPVTHILFDIDGLLLDTEKVYYQIFKDIAAKYGKQEFSWEVYKKLMGRKETEAGMIFLKEMELPITIDEFIKLLEEMQYKSFLNVSLMPGAERLVFHLKKYNIPMALASGSRIEFIKLKFANHSELFQCFAHIVASSTDPEVKKGKPAPDVFLVCASRFPDKPTPRNCLVFEDAPNGIAAAVNAGMQVVMVPDHRLSPELTKNATLVLNSLTEFQPELFGLPSFSL